MIIAERLKDRSLRGYGERGPVRTERVYLDVVDLAEGRDDTAKRLRVSIGPLWTPEK